MTTGSFSFGLTAKEMMTKKLVTIQPDQQVYEAVQLLIKKGISGAPVVDDKYRLVGIVSEKDCIQTLVQAIHHRLPSSKVEDVMSTNITSVEVDADFLSIAHLFLTKPVRRIPVLNGAVLVGQISRRDLLASAVKVFKTATNREAALLYLSALHDRGEYPPSIRSLGRS
jgi:predicted transcriptional regulator